MSKSAQEHRGSVVVSLRPVHGLNSQGLRKVRFLCVVIAAGAAITLGWTRLSAYSGESVESPFALSALHEEKSLNQNQIDTTEASESDHALANYYAALRCFDKEQDVDAGKAIDHAQGLRPLSLVPEKCHYPAPRWYVPGNLVSAVARGCAERALVAARKGDEETMREWIGRGHHIAAQILTSASSEDSAATLDALRTSSSIDMRMGTTEETCLQCLGKTRESERLHRREEQRRSYYQQEVRPSLSGQNIRQEQVRPDDPAIQLLVKKLSGKYAAERVRLGLATESVLVGAPSIEDRRRSTFTP